MFKYYPQQYKEEFREIIAPSLERVESFKVYYDEWGARAYLFAGVDENVYQPVRNLEISDHTLHIDSEALCELGGKYIFSRIEIDNADELELSLRGVYTQEDSPYTIYLYETEEMRKADISYINMTGMPFPLMAVYDGYFSL